MTDSVVRVYAGNVVVLVERKIVGRGAKIVLN